MPKRITKKILEDLSIRQLYDSAYAALLDHKIELFLSYLEALRRRFILITAMKNDAITSRRNLLIVNGQVETLGSPSADAFEKYYKKMRTPVTIDTLKQKKAYIIHSYLSTYAYVTRSEKVDPASNDFNSEFERLIRYELFYKIMTAFFPALESAAGVEDEPDERQLVDQMKTDLRVSLLNAPTYFDLSRVDKEAILEVSNADWILSFSAEDMRSFFKEIKEGVDGQPSIRNEVSIDERDKFELDALLAKRLEIEDPIFQIKHSQLRDSKNCCLAFVLNEEQILDVLADKSSIVLSEVQVESLLDRVSRKCPNFSHSYYDRPVNFIKNRSMLISPELKRAVIQNCLGLEGRRLEVYSELKRAELVEKQGFLKTLDKFVVKTEMITLEDLKGISLMGLNKTLLRLQDKEQAQWIRWKNGGLLKMKIDHLRAAISLIKMEEVSFDKAKLLAQLKSLKTSRLLQQHQNWFYRLFKPLCKTSSVIEIEQVIKECEEGAEENIRQQSYEAFVVPAAAAAG